MGKLIQMVWHPQLSCQKSKSWSGIFSEGTDLQVYGFILNGVILTLMICGGRGRRGTYFGVGLSKLCGVRFALELFGE